MYDSITQLAQEILQGELGLSAEMTWERPSESSHGDLATPIALQLAKTAKKNPQDIASLLRDALSEHADVEKAEIAGPGYVNLWFTADALIKQLAQTREACTAKVTRKEKPVIVEFSDPNIAKPLGIHHILTTIIGQSISNLYQHDGFPVINWNYMGDWGTQFGKLAVAYEKWGSDKPVSEYTVDELLALYIRFHEEAEKEPDLEEEGRKAFRKLEQGDEELRAFWADVVSVTKSTLHDLYERLHVSFDTDISESFYEDKMEPVLQEGIEKEVFKEGEGGALIVEFPEETNMPPYMVQKSDGGTLYSTRDIAQMRYRMDEYDPQSILIVTDIAQKLHFEQLEETCNQLEWELPHFENVLFGRMRFADKSMSTRKGTVLKLEDVIAEAVNRADALIAEHGDSIQTDDPKELAEMMGTGSLAYGILSQNRKMDLVFDWDKCLTLEGNSAPYLQYTHARAKSVLRKGEMGDSINIPDVDELTERERQLINELLRFSDVLDSARKAHMPHLLANYLFSLSQEYNAFYNAEPILKAEEPKKTLRLALTSLVARVIKTGAELLTLRVPESM